MTPAEEIARYLEAGAALEKEATEGPWTVRDCGCCDEEPGERAKEILCPPYHGTTVVLGLGHLCVGSAVFIAAAREREPRERRALARALRALDAATRHRIDPTVCLNDIAAILRGE